MNYETAEYSLYDSVSFLREQDDSNQSRRLVLPGIRFDFPQKKIQTESPRPTSKIGSTLSSLLF